MKRILITGANSYIGVSFETYLKENYPDGYAVDTLDMLDGSWREADFSGYDTVFHVAGIAHRKETRENRDLYYQVNRDLAVAVAEKAKNAGVGQFIFLSSMSVYGKERGIITRETVPAPKTNYGRSKLQAEEALASLRSPDFRIAVLRPPMVYGKGCKGNFQTVVKIVSKLPVFPRIKNARSMIYIENLVVFVKLCVDRGLDGLYFPQNREYVSTVDMARGIAKALGKRRYFSFLLGAGVWLGRPFVSMLQKAFGSLIYRDTEDFSYEYCVTENTESFPASL